MPLAYTTRLQHLQRELAPSSWTATQQASNPWRVYTKLKAESSLGRAGRTHNNNLALIQPTQLDAKRKCYVVGNRANCEVEATLTEVPVTLVV